MAPNTNICHIRNRMISHFSFHESVFVGSPLRLLGKPPVGGRSLGEYRNPGLASLHWCQSLLCHSDTSQTPSKPPTYLPPMPLPLSLFSASRPVPLHLSHSLTSHSFGLSLHRSRSLFDPELSTDNWLLTHSPKTAISQSFSILRLRKSHRLADTFSTSNFSFHPFHHFHILFS